MDYNYKRFRTSNYEYEKFPGPRAGEIMPDFTLHGLDGKQVNLAEYRGTWVVIETGSSTCPMFVKNINPFKKLIPKYPDVVFLVVYVREAHPGSRTLPHETLQEKMALAAEMQKEYDDPRDMLVDGIGGELHRAIGCFPNMVYVVDPNGRVVYRCDWSFAHLVGKVLEDRPNINPEERKQIITAAPWIMIPVTLKGGWDALWDLVIELPGILWGHLKVDMARLFRGKQG